jgi:riboflavin synthase
MFTGLIEGVGSVADLTPLASGYRLHVRTPLAAGLAAGDSLAVDGVCLTVTHTDGAEVHADVGPETARITALGLLRRDQPVNLERAMRADSRVGGHFVQGHVDGLGVVAEIRPDGDSHWLTVTFDPGLAPYLVQKGSVAVNGISLTVARLGGNVFDVMIIPHTWEKTNLSSLRVGDRVNLECDMIGKYVARAVELFGVGRSMPAATDR